jgi:hypothetical protein
MVLPIPAKLSLDRGYKLGEVLAKTVEKTVMIYSTCMFATNSGAMRLNFDINTEKRI